MSKLFGSRPVGAVAIVDAPVSRHYAQRARLAFFGTLPVTVLVAVAVLSLLVPLPFAVGLGLIVGGAVALVAAIVVRIWPVLRVLWWWLPEIVAFMALDLGLSYLSHYTSPVLALSLLIGLGVVAALVPPVRRWVVAWWWCGLVRHRLRMSFAQFIRAAGRGNPVSLPLILLARPTPAGERVWVWLRPGLDLTDLEGKTPKLAVACWASEVRVVRASARYAALLRVDIARRDPLTGLVSSPLADLFASWAQSDAPVSPGMPPLGLDLDDVPEPPPEPRSTRR